MPHNRILYKSFEINQNGKDYIIGDIHGMFSELDRVLKKIKFNKKKDRLFCTGDLVNKGAECEKVLKYLQQPWFFSVMGNNDEMIAYNIKPKDYQKNGTKWIKCIGNRTTGHIKSLLKKLPIAIEIENKRGQKIGITHADALPNWRDYQLSLITREDIEYTINSRVAALQAKKGHEMPSQWVKGIDYIFHGHTINHDTHMPMELANRYFIDCGAYKKIEKDNDYGFCIYDIDNLTKPIYMKGNKIE